MSNLMGWYVHCALLFCSEIKQQVIWFILDTAIRTNYTSNKWHINTNIS